MDRDKAKLWPTELLFDEIREANPRIMLVRYESKRLESEHLLFNIPDHDLEDLAH
jgi:hypothetical protein